MINEYIDNKIMFIKMFNGEFEYAYELPEDYDYEVVECNNLNLYKALDDLNIFNQYTYKKESFILKRIGNIKKNIIKILIGFGEVKSVFNLPKNYDYEVIERNK
jgi:hypothetical protein